MSLAALSARQACALLTYHRLTSRTTNHRTYLLKVGLAELLKVNILHTRWKPATGFSSTLSLAQLCLRRDEAHAIVQCHFRSRHPFCITSCDSSSLSKLQQFASVTTINHYHSSILSSLHHFLEILLTFFFYPFHTRCHQTPWAYGTEHGL